MKLLIVDGIPETRNYYLENIAGEYKTDVFHAVSAEDAAFQILDIKPDIVVISEILSFRSGFELARIIQKNEMNIPVILIANDADNAIQAIGNNIFDFLLMPLSSKMMNLSIKKAIQFIREIHTSEELVKSPKEDVKVRMKTIKGYRLIDMQHMLYCEAEGAYTNLFFNDGTSYYTTYNLGRIEGLIKTYNFIRINRSVLVNLSRVREVNKKDGKCIIDDEKSTSFKMSKKYIRKLETESIL
ncbi:MAG: LytTR family DNA-binding domain-containing protein [Prolixibacteraceae bacterium]|jgi:two-component system LytT family response regulator|nr:LytTR family DNA-binding domain-containing protein [Prolixibacteraceae bacterium]